MKTAMILFKANQNPNFQNKIKKNRFEGIITMCTQWQIQMIQMLVFLNVGDGWHALLFQTGRRAFDPC